MSGVTVQDDCVTKFEEMKTRHLYKYIIYKIENKKEIVIDCIGEKGATYDEFKNKLLEDKSQPRYALVDMSYNTADGRPQEKLVFLFYSDDDNTGVKDRMLYASSKDAIKKKLPGVMKEHQANASDALEESAVIETCLK
mmetsp:Transcript_70251/g.168325  ORF Transcript_70251/g.168325 Transcript_70251/m.168325 type:complete len:139 (+) Transcript_70251:92-508(+)